MNTKVVALCATILAAAATPSSANASCIWCGIPNVIGSFGNAFGYHGGYGRHHPMRVVRMRNEHRPRSPGAHRCMYRGPNAIPPGPDGFNAWCD